MISVSGPEALVRGIPVEALPSFQEEKLKQFAKRTRASTSYYGDQFEHLLRNSSSFVKEWREMPIMTKEEVRVNLKSLTATRLAINAGAVRAGSTSGSTGAPMKFLWTEYCGGVDLAMNARVFKRWGMDGSKTLMATLISRRGDKDSHAVGQGWHPLGGNGEYHKITSSELIDQHDIIIRTRPSYLKTYPAILDGLSEFVRESGRSLSFDLILSGGSVLEDHVRQACLDVFNSRIVNLYGTAEVGLIAFECPDCGEYHMCFENNFTEIIKDDGEPAEPGEIGRVITTNFQNDAMPLVRYDVGDYAQRGFGVEPCARQPFTLRRIIGRHKTLFLRPDGTKFWPRFPHELAIDLGIRRYRMVQPNRSRIEFLYLPVARYYQAAHRESRKFRLRGIPKVRAPTLSIYTSDDPVIYRGAFRNTAGWVDNDVETIVLPLETHFPHQERADTVNLAISDWLGGL